MAQSALLNAEPARPEERERLNLRPKSFAEAVEQEVSVDERVSAKTRRGRGGLTNGRKKGGVNGGHGEKKVNGGDERAGRIERDRSGKDGGEVGKTEGQSEEAAWVEDVQKSCGAAVSTLNIHYKPKSRS